MFSTQHHRLVSAVTSGLNNVLPVTQNLGQSQQGSCPAVSSVPPVAQCAGRQHQHLPLTSPYVISCYHCVDVPLEQVGSPTVGVWARRTLTVSTMLSAASTVVRMSVRDQVSQYHY